MAASLLQQLYSSYGKALVRFDPDQPSRTLGGGQAQLTALGALIAQYTHLLTQIGLPLHADFVKAIWAEASVLLDVSGHRAGQDANHRSNVALRRRVQDLEQQLSQMKQIVSNFYSNIKNELDASSMPVQPSLQLPVAKWKRDDRSHDQQQPFSFTMPAARPTLPNDTAATTSQPAPAAWLLSAPPATLSATPAPPAPAAAGDSSTTSKPAAETSSPEELQARLQYPTVRSYDERKRRQQTGGLARHASAAGRHALRTSYASKLHKLKNTSRARSAAATAPAAPVPTAPAAPASSASHPTAAPSIPKQQSPQTSPAEHQPHARTSPTPPPASPVRQPQPPASHTSPKVQRQPWSMATSAAPPKQPSPQKSPSPTAPQVHRPPWSIATATTSAAPKQPSPQKPPSQPPHARAPQLVQPAHSAQPEASTAQQLQAAPPAQLVHSVSAAAAVPAAAHSGPPAQPLQPANTASAPAARPSQLVQLMPPAAAAQPPPAVLSAPPAQVGQQPWVVTATAAQPQQAALAMQQQYQGSIPWREDSPASSFAAPELLPTESPVKPGQQQQQQQQPKYQHMQQRAQQHMQQQQGQGHASSHAGLAAAQAAAAPTKASAASAAPLAAKPQPPASKMPPRKTINKHGSRVSSSRSAPHTSKAVMQQHPVPAAPEPEPPAPTLPLQLAAIPAMPTQPAAPAAAPAAALQPLPALPPLAAMGLQLHSPRTASLMMQLDRISSARIELEQMCPAASDHNSSSVLLGPSAVGLVASEDSSASISTPAPAAAAEPAAATPRAQLMVQPKASRDKPPNSIERLVLSSIVEASVKLGNREGDTAELLLRGMDERPASAGSASSSSARREEQQQDGDEEEQQEQQEEQQEEQQGGVLEADSSMQRSLQSLSADDPAAAPRLTLDEVRSIMEDIMQTNTNPYLPFKQQLLDYVHMNLSTEMDIIVTMAGITRALDFYSSIDPEIALFNLALANRAPVSFLQVLQRNAAEVEELAHSHLAGMQDTGEIVTIEEDPLLCAADLGHVLLSMENVGESKLARALQYVSNYKQEVIERCGELEHETSSTLRLSELVAATGLMLLKEHQEEIQYLIDAFQEADEAGTGVLDLSAFKAFCRASNNALSDDEAAEVFGHVLVESCGCASFEAIMSAWFSEDA